MKKVVVTKELIESYPYKGSKHTPDRPWCRLCSTFKGRTKEKRLFRVLKIGQQAIEITFRNGTVAFYHKRCWDDPGNKERVRAILKQDVYEAREKVQPTTKAIVTPE